MPFMLVDDLLNSHPKARRAGLEAMGLWVMAGSQVALQLTDGVVPDWYVASWPDGDVAAKKLVDAGLWHDHGHDCPKCPQPPAGQWIFHEWTAVNPTRERVLARREARKAAGQRGGLARAQAHAQAKAVATPQALAQASATPLASSNGRTPSPSPSPSSQSVVTLVRLLTSAGAQGVTTTTIENWAAKNTPDADVEAETARFLAVNAGKDIHDLRAAWQAWMRGARPANERVTIPAGRKAGEPANPALRPDDPRCDKPGHETELASSCRICASERLAGGISDPTDLDEQGATP